MQKINKIILIFFILCAAVVYGGWEYIHSEQFSKEASLKISKQLFEKAGTTLNFSQVDFSLFPLKTTFRDVEIEKNDPSLFNTAIKTKDLEIRFSYSSFLSKDLQIQELLIRDGSIDLSIFTKSNKKIDISKFNTEDFFTQYLNIYVDLPVKFKNISFENISLSVDELSTEIKNATISPARNRIQVDIELFNTGYYLDNFKTYPLFVDHIKLKGVIRNESWRVDELFIREGKQTLESKGVLNNLKNGLNLKTNGEIALDVTDIKNKIHLSDMSYFDESSGSLNLNFETSGLLSNQEILLDISGKDIESKWINLEKINLQLTKKNNDVLVNKFSAKNNKEVYYLKKQSNLFNLDSLKFHDFKLEMNLRDAFTNTFLYSINDTLSGFKGHLTGDIDVILDSEKISFNIPKNVNLKDFKLTTIDGKSTILQNKGFDLTNSKIILDKNYDLKITTDIRMKNSYLKVNGDINDLGIDFSIRESTLDLLSLGPISGVTLTGQGPIDVSIKGPFDDVIFDFDVDWSKFSVLDINLGKVQSDFKFHIKDLLLEIESLKSEYKNSELKGVGLIGFDDSNEGLDLKVDIIKSSYSDFKEIVALVFNEFKLPEDPKFTFQGDVNLKGGFGLDSLNIKGNVRAVDFTFFNETADRLTLDFSLINSTMLFDNVTLYKSRGTIHSVATINLNNDSFVYSAYSKGLRLRDFNLYRRTNLKYDGDFNLIAEGQGSFNKFTSRVDLSVINAFIGNRPVSTSSLSLSFTQDELHLIGNWLNDSIQLESLASWNSGLAAIQLDINTDNVKEILGVISEHNLDNEALKGVVDAKLLANVDIKSLIVRNFELDIKDFEITNNNLNLKVNKDHNKVIVKDGLIQHWDLAFTDNDNYLISRARNLSKGVVEIYQDFSIGANALEILTSMVEKAEGSIEGNVKLRLDNRIEITALNIEGINQYLKIKDSPSNITGLNYQISKNKDVYNLKSLNGYFGEGSVRANGQIKFNDFYPEVILNYDIDNSKIPLLKKSNIMISGEGSLKGNKMPYVLEGQVEILHGEILEDLSEFLKSSRISINEYKKFLPDRRLDSGLGLLELDLNFKTTGNVSLKNNLAEVYVKGSGELKGDIMSPSLNLRTDLIPILSKLKFKGHDFLLSQGFIEFNERGKNIYSDLKVTGSSTISDYLVKIDVGGSIDNINIDLSSEPALSKEDLLSLVTFGVTSDMSKDLEATDRRSVTTVGIGTLLVDQLKINEDLNSAFGLKLSVAPEFKEDESTLIQGKSAQSEGSTSRLKSATKIKINKQISDKVDVSVSSTVGGSLEQKQEMNVNYIINKNFSIEGVYEVKPNEDENGTTPNSFGIDFKWRKSF